MSEPTTPAIVTLTRVLPRSAVESIVEMATARQSGSIQLNFSANGVVESWTETRHHRRESKR